MSAIHFDITGDNSNIVDLVNETTKKMEELAEVADAISGSFDMSNPEKSIESISAAIERCEQIIEGYKDQLEDLADKQRDAALAGDADAVREYGEEMEKVAQDMEDTTQACDALRDALESANGEMEENDGIMVRLLGGQEKYNEILNKLPGPLRKVTQGINGMVGASKAFIATPLGAILAAIILAFKALSTWLNKSSEGQQKLAKITGYLSGVLAGVRQIVMDVGKALFKAFTEPKKAVTDLWNTIKTHIVDRIQSVGRIGVKLGEILSNAFKFKFDDAKESLKDLGNELKDFAKNSVAGKMVTGTADAVKNIHEIGKAEADLNARRNALHRQQTAWMTEEAELDRQIAEERNKLRVGSDADRAAAAARMQELINQKTAKQVEMAREEYEIKKASNALTTSSQEDLDEEQALLAKVTQMETQGVRAKGISMRIEDSLNRKAESAARQVEALADKRNELVRTFGESAEEVEERTTELTIAAMQDGFEKEMAELESEHNQRVAQIRREYDDRMRAIESLQKEEYKSKHGGSTTGFVFNENDEIAVSALGLMNAKLDNENKQFEIATRDHLQNLVKQYQTFEQKEAEIIRVGEEEIAALEREGYAEQAKIRRQAMEKELTELRSHEKDIYKRLAQDTSKWGIVSIQKAIVDAQQTIDELASDPDKAIANADAIENLRNAIERLKGTANDFSLPGVLKMLLTEDEGSDAEQSIAERISAMRQAWKDMSKEQKWKNIGGWTSSIASGLGQAAEYMRQIAEASGNTKLAESAEKVGAFADMASAAGKGAAQGGWIGALVGLGTSLLSQVADGITQIRVQEELAKEAARQWVDILKDAATTINDDAFSSVFGNMGVAKGREAMRASISSMERYYEKLGELNAKYDEGVEKTFNSSYLNPLPLETLLDNALYKLTGFNANLMARTNNDWKTYQEAIQKGYKGLQTMLVKTKDYNSVLNFLGFQDQYTALADLYPELFKDGELVIENAKKLLSVENQLDEKQRQELQNLIDLKEGYENAMKAVDDAISQNFGSLASDITDIIWDSVMTGTDAWKQFQEVGSEAISRLGKQMIQEMLISEYLEQYRERMRDAYKKGNSEETQKELRDITSDIFGGMEAMLASGTMVAEEYKKWAAEHGFDLTNASSQTQNATAGGFATMSQDTGNELNGRFTSVQISNESIAQSAREGLLHIISIGEMVSSGGATLAEIRNLHLLEVGFLEDIAKFTKPLLEVGGKLDMIKQNTDRL